MVRALERSPADVDPDIHGQVEAILSAVRARGDSALLEFTERFDRVRLQAPELAVTAAEYDAAERAVGANTLRALQYAAGRIEEFHRHGLPRSWWVEDANGSLLGQQVRPLDRVGIYVPGGRAAYPSTVLMTAVPAHVAGVPEIVLVSPPSQDKSLNAAVLAAARVAGVTEAYR
ncbi:MAG: histidinol dehydrogenase, partial [Candidatus Rokuibacteriota bacterium]